MAIRRICILTAITLVLGSMTSWAQSLTYYGIDYPGAGQTLPQGINNLGQVVGSYLDPTGRENIFVMSEGAFTLTSYPDAWGFATAWGINDYGQIAGWYAGNNGIEGFLLSGGTFTTISYPGAGLTTARQMNNSGQIIGGYGPTTDDHSYVLMGNEFTVIEYPGAESTSVRRSNNLGQIVGIYTIEGYRHGFLLSGGSFTTIDYPGARHTTLEGINDSGDIVGWYLGMDGLHGFLWSKGRFTIIDYPGSYGSKPSAINNDGLIVGRYYDWGGDQRGYLAAPVAPVEYRYTGTSFNLFNCASNTLCDTPNTAFSSYTKDDFVSVTLALDAPLPSNLDLTDITSFAGFRLIISDGHQILLNPDEVKISTDANGDIVAPWSVISNGLVPPNNGIYTVNWPGFRGISDGGTLSAPTTSNPEIPRNQGMIFNSPGMWEKQQVSAAELTEDALDYINDLIFSSELKPKQANGLLKPLENAMSSIQNGKYAAACSQIQDFIDEVIAKTPSPLSEETSEGLISEANAIQALVPCAN